MMVFFIFIFIFLRFYVYLLHMNFRLLKYIVIVLVLLTLDAWPAPFYLQLRYIKSHICAAATVVRFSTAIVSRRNTHCTIVLDIRER